MSDAVVAGIVHHAAQCVLGEALFVVGWGGLHMSEWVVEWVGGWLMCDGVAARASAGTRVGRGQQNRWAAGDRADEGWRMVMIMMRAEWRRL